MHVGCAGSVVVSLCKLQKKLLLLLLVLLLLLLVVDARVTALHIAATYTSSKQAAEDVVTCAAVGSDALTVTPREQLCVLLHTARSIIYMYSYMNASATRLGE